MAPLWALFAADAFDKTAAIAAAGLGSKRGRRSARARLRSCFAPEQIRDLPRATWKKSGAKRRGPAQGGLGEPAGNPVDHFI